MREERQRLKQLNMFQFKFALAATVTGCRGAVPSVHTRPCCSPIIEAAHKKGAGSTKNGRDSNSKRRGVKVYGGQPIGAGGIIVRQLGTKFHPGPGASVGKDYTLYALTDGIVDFHITKHKRRVSVIPFEEYTRPEGNTLKPGSRKSRRKEQYPPRALLAEQEPELVAA